MLPTFLSFLRKVRQMCALPSDVFIIGARSLGFRTLSLD
jgi:hypothetical protein